MGDFQVKKQSKKYDAVIIGSGAGGGMATYVLANAGLKKWFELSFRFAKALPPKK